jgi:uncharacterized protein (DUF1697 family)
MPGKFLYYFAMKIYAAFLRAVNVGGRNIVPMSPLKDLLLKSGYQEVVTLLNSGNLVFRSDAGSPSTIGKNISGLIERKFRVDTPALVVDITKLKKVIDACPFDERALTDGQGIYVTFLNGAPTDSNLSALKSVRNGTDECMFSNQVVYVLAKNGYSNTVFNNNFIEKTLKVEATTRNTNTLKKIVEIGKGMS